MPASASSGKNLPVDVVITWVDGNDHRLIEKMEPFLQGQDHRNDPGTNLTRFASVNEIRYCVLSILTFAPFVRNIFIVTDGQDPNLDEDIRTWFPERRGSIRIVDHSEIFRDFEEYLPTFNSRSIECMLWRIPGLSDNFVYFNDDTFLVRKIRPEDWFIDNRPVLRGKWLPIPLPWFFWDFIRKTVNKCFLNNPDYQPRPSFHLGQWLSASILGMKYRYFVYSHTPHAIDRRRVEKFFSGKKELLEKNIAYRFRNHKQFIFAALSGHLELLDGNEQITSPDLAYLQPLNRPKNYIDKKIRFCENNPRIKFLCVQSLEMCRKEDQKKLFSWMETLLQLNKV
ncbi:MAG: capsular biosynthesis protein [Marinilabiliales bacterium]|nr:MAG: capsular biosynthesis protein [Marinilabiliales bacterium]